MINLYIYIVLQFPKTEVHKERQVVVKSSIENKNISTSHCEIPECLWRSSFSNPMCSLMITFSESSGKPSKHPGNDKSPQIFRQYDNMVLTLHLSLPTHLSPLIPLFQPYYTHSQLKTIMPHSSSSLIPRCKAGLTVCPHLTSHL